MGLHGCRLDPGLLARSLDVAGDLLVCVPVELLGVNLCLVLSARLVELVPVLTLARGGELKVGALVTGLLRHAGEVTQV